MIVSAVGNVPLLPDELVELLDELLDELPGQSSSMVWMLASLAQSLASKHLACASVTDGPQSWAQPCVA